MYRLYRDGNMVNLTALTEKIEAGEETLEGLRNSTWEIADYWNGDITASEYGEPHNYSRSTVRRLEDFNDCYYGDTDDMNALIDEIENLLTVEEDAKSTPPQS